MSDRKPWSVKGIDTRARAAALEAARAEGVTLGDYINKLLLESSNEADTGSLQHSTTSAHQSLMEDIPRQVANGPVVTAPRQVEPNPKNSSSDLHNNLDWLTTKIEAVEGRSTLAITGIDKSLMGLVARIESVENGQTDTAEHLTSILEDVKSTQDELQGKIRVLEKDDAPQQNLEIIRSLEQAMGKLAAEMYTRHEALDKDRKAVDERFTALDRRNAEFMGKVRESEERTRTEFDTYTTALDDRLKTSVTDIDERLTANETRQRQALSESESRQRTHISELEERVEGKLNQSIKASNRFVENHTEDRLNTLQKELTQKLGQAVQSQSEALSEFEARQEDVFGQKKKALADAEARLNKLENLTTEKFEGLKETTVRTVDTLAGSIQSTNARLDKLQEAQKLEKHTLKDEKKQITDFMDDTGEGFAKLQGDIGEIRKSLADTSDVINAETDQKITEIKTTVDDVTTAINQNSSAIKSLENALASQNSNLDTRFKAQSELLETRMKSQGAGLDDAMIALDSVSEKVGDLSKRAEKAEASTNIALQTLAKNLSSLEAHLSSSDENTHSLFEAFAQQLQNLVENNRAQLAKDLSATIARTEALEKRLDSDMPASEENVAEMREKFDELQKRVTSGEIQQAATLSTISREIDIFSERFEQRLQSAENGISRNEEKATNALRGELVEFSKMIQERIAKVETGLKHTKGQGEQETKNMTRHLQEMEHGFAMRLQDADERNQRAIEHIGQQVASASARSQQRQEETMSQFESRLGSIEQKTEERLSSALTNISERLEQIQTQTVAATAPIQKSISDISQRIDAIEDFKAPSHIKGPPPVQAANSGAMAGFNTSPNMASPTGPSSIPSIGPAPNPNAGFNTSQRPTTPRNSGADLRQNFAPSSPPLQSSQGSNSSPMVDHSAYTATEQKGTGGGSSVRKYLPLVLIGAAGLAGASWMLRGKSSPAPQTTPTSRAQPAVTTASSAQSTRSDIPDLAESEALLEAYDIQINSAQVDPRLMQDQRAQDIAHSRDNALAGAALQTQPFSALSTLSPLVYTKPISAEQAAAAGDAIAQLVVAQKRAKSGDAIGAADMLKKAAAQGQGMAHYLLGQMYDMGKGVDKDPQLAFNASRNAAQAGNIKAMHDYGAYLHEGKYVGRNDAEAAFWFKKAANHGLLDSQYNLGLMYMDGIGVPRNPEDALFWLSLAEKAGDPDAGGVVGALKARMDPAAIARVTSKISGWKKAVGDGPANGNLGSAPWNTDAKATIKEMQKALNIMGYEAGAPDGAIGPKTARAIRSFERDNGMGETGRLNEGLIHTINAKIRDASL